VDNCVDREGGKSTIGDTNSKEKAENEEILVSL
jgi:hypothetical protein